MPQSMLPSPSPVEMEVLLARAGLTLNPGQLADLVLSWRQLAGLIAILPQERKMGDDQAFAFRLTPPAPVGKAQAPAKAKPVAKAKAPGKAKAKAAPGKAKPAPAKAAAKTGATKARAAVKPPARAKPAAPRRTRT